MAKPKQILSVRERNLIIALYEEGKTDAQVAEVLKIKRTTFMKVCAYNGLSDTIKSVKVGPNELVEKSLYMRARGYEYVEEKIEEEEITLMGKNAEGEKVFIPAKKVKTTRTPKHMPADTTADIYWTKNRDPARWRDKIDHEHGGNIVIKA